MSINIEDIVEYHALQATKVTAIGEALKLILNEALSPDIKAETGLRSHLRCANVYVPASTDDLDETLYSSLIEINADGRIDIHMIWAPASDPVDEDSESLRLFFGWNEPPASISARIISAMQTSDGTLATSLQAYMEGRAQSRHQVATFEANSLD